MKESDWEEKKKNFDQMLDDELRNEQNLPTLYTDAEGNRAIKMSEVFVPNEKSKCQNLVRNRML